MEQVESIEGIVLDVIQGDSFLLKLTTPIKSSLFQPIERIRIKDVKCPALDSYEGILARNRLNARLQHKKVRCTVHQREADYFLLCDIEVIPVNRVS
ncbi:hypothetical protein L0128_11595 [candidate division KSB1 bacterium]|nr:hypothetical protein [candidate division KSB1 bacterium]